MVVSAPCAGPVDVRPTGPYPLLHAPPAERSERDLKIAATEVTAGNGVRVAADAGQEIDAIIANAVDWRGEMLSRLRDIVVGADPAIEEQVKWKKPSRPEGVPVWSADGNVCIGEMLKAAVRLTFPKGAELKDPTKLFNARLDSKTVRAIDFREGADLPEAAVKALVQQAIRLNG